MINITKNLTIPPEEALMQSLFSCFTDKLSKTLFFDIETTGFSPKSSICYLIGCVYYREDQWHYTQWFAENEADEPTILNAFFQFLTEYENLVHFNGDGFDLPFLLGRCKRFELPYDFTNITSTDLFKCARSLRKLLNLENYKQKTIEIFLGIDREDECSGGELIQVYQSYTKHPTQDQLNLLLLHNHDDIIGLLQLIPILFYRDIATFEWSQTKAMKNEASDYEGNEILEVIIQAHLPHSLPTPVSLTKEHFYLSAVDQTLRLRVPVYCGEVKYFYPNYKDYYYLINEDCAMHKSVASYVDKQFRKQAKASNCYTRKNGHFLLQETDLFSPSFKQNYEDTHYYFELSDAFLNDSEQLSNYIIDLLRPVLA